MRAGLGSPSQKSGPEVSRCQHGLSAQGCASQENTTFSDTQADPPPCSPVGEGGGFPYSPSLSCLEASTDPITTPPPPSPNHHLLLMASPEKWEMRVQDGWEKSCSLLKTI